MLIPIWISDAATGPKGADTLVTPFDVSFCCAGYMFKG